MFPPPVRVTNKITDRALSLDQRHLGCPVERSGTPHHGKTHTRVARWWWWWWYTVFWSLINFTPFVTVCLRVRLPRCSRTVSSPIPTINAAKVHCHVAWTPQRETVTTREIFGARYGTLSCAVARWFLQKCIHRATQKKHRERAARGRDSKKQFIKNYFRNYHPWCAAGRYGTVYGVLFCPVPKVNPKYSSNALPVGGKSNWRHLRLRKWEGRRNENTGKGRGNTTEKRLSGEWKNV